MDDETHADFAIPGEDVTIGTVTVTEPETMAEVFVALGKSCSLCDDGREPCACGLVVA